MSIDVMTQALHYTRPGAIVPVTPETVKILVDALRLAIDQAERQEPVAYLPPTPHQENALYTTPPQRQPLNAKEIAATVLDHCYGPGAVTDDMIDRATRAIERKHGIGGSHE